MKMNKTTFMIIGGVLVAGGLGFWLYKRNKNKKMIGSETGNTSNISMGSSVPNITPVNIIEQPKPAEVKAAPKNIGAE